MKWASITTLIYVSRKESDVQDILKSPSVNNAYGHDVISGSKLKLSHK